MLEGDPGEAGAAAGKLLRRDTIHLAIGSVTGTHHGYLRLFRIFVISFLMALPKLSERIAL